ncbi:MAG TPA: hypothetical protein VNA25_04055 [Phycisphaerae bacterium]|nr:hypothetical protein [Phycisphaerae bacterium]
MNPELAGVHEAAKCLVRAIEKVGEPERKFKPGDDVVHSCPGFDSPCVIISAEEFEREHHFAPGLPYCIRDAGDSIWCSDGTDLSPWQPKVGDRVWVEGEAPDVGTFKGFGEVAALDIGDTMGCEVCVAAEDSQWPAIPQGEEASDEWWFRLSAIRPADFAPKEAVVEKQKVPPRKLDPDAALRKRAETWACGATALIDDLVGFAKQELGRGKDAEECSTS